MKRFLPRSLTGQTILALLLGLTLSHLLSLLIYSRDRAEFQALAGGREMAHRIAAIAQLIEETPDDWHERLMAGTSSATLRVFKAPESAIVTPGREDWRSELVAGLIKESLPQYRPADVQVQVMEVMRPDDGGFHPVRWLPEPLAPYLRGFVPPHEALRVSVRLKNGDWLNFVSTVQDPDVLWSRETAVSLVIMVLTVLALSVWLVRRMTRPIKEFAGASDRLGKDVNAPALSETGPQELRQAARAFNRMQRRLRRLLDNRTRMLAAISHDLRTPITLLRLRAEFVDNETERSKMLATLDGMEEMIASVLAFARRDAEAEESRKVDLAALIGSLCDDLTDAGGAVDYRVPQLAPLDCRPVSLTRALTNLVGNAVKYGHRARVRVYDVGDGVRIVVEDDGPGIPDAEMGKVFNPFYRVEGSRSRDTGGSGLGLSIARAVIDSHGGTLELRNRPEGGLRVTVLLPR